MRYDRNRAIAVLMLCLVILLATSFYITPTGISDTDPSTYVIVPILMLPLLMLFTFKSDIKPKVGKRDVAIGIAAFVAFLALTVLLRIYFSFYFVSFRIDLLLMPLAIAALASLLFGVWSIGKFKGAMFYSMLASPAILYPIARMAGAFAQINSLIIYGVIKPFVSGLQYSAPITISLNGNSVGIGQSCVSVGIFIALALFLIPIAYLYDGKTKRKALWIASGLALLLVLNLIRMLGISLVWLTYGESQTALLVHAFFGTFIFYAAIAVMILTSGFYGLGISRGRKQKKAKTHSKVNALYVAAALALSMAYLYLTLNYSSSLNVSPLAIAQRTTFNFTNVQISTALSNIVDRGNFSSVVISNAQGTYAAFSLWNKTINATTPFMLVATVPSKDVTESMIKNNTLLGIASFFNRNGMTERVYDIVSENAEYVVYNSDLPLVLENMTSAMTSFYIIIPAEDLANVTCSAYDPVYSGIMNLANPVNYNETIRQRIYSAECISNRILWK